MTPLVLRLMAYLIQDWGLDPIAAGMLLTGSALTTLTLAGKVLRHAYRHLRGTPPSPLARQLLDVLATRPLEVLHGRSLTTTDNFSCANGVETRRPKVTFYPRTPTLPFSVAINGYDVEGRLTRNDRRLLERAMAQTMARHQAALTALEEQKIDGEIAKLPPPSLTV